MEDSVFQNTSQEIKFIFDFWTGPLNKTEIAELQ